MSETVKKLQATCAFVHYQDSSSNDLLSVTPFQPLLPSVCTADDANQLLASVMRTKPTAIVLCDSFVTSEAFLTSCSVPFESLINAKAEKVSSSLILDLGKKNDLEN